MFVINQDYIIKNYAAPVLMRQKDGKFDFTGCYFLEFIIKNNDETIKKIETLCAPFDFKTVVQYAISKHNYFSDNDVLRLFLLAGPDIIRNNFTRQDDFLAVALCNDFEKRTKIQYFEVNCKFKLSFEPNQKYRKVGTSAVNELKKIYQTRELFGESALYALKFWLKNGFTSMDGQEQYIHWRQR